MTAQPPCPLMINRRTLTATFLAGLLPVFGPGARAAPTSHFDVVEIAPSVFVHTGQTALVTSGNNGDISNPAFVVGGRGVAVIDTSGSYRSGAALRAAIGRVTPKPILYVINTHMHPDHVFGNAAFEADAPQFVAHHKMGRGLAARAESYLRRAKDNLGAAFEGTRIVMPTVSISDETTLDLGGRVLTLKPRPTAHTDNDLTIRDETTGTLLLGDLLFSGHIPTLDGSLRGWLTLIDTLMAEKAERVVPGHGPQSMSWPDAILPEKRYLETVAADVRAKLKSGETMTEAVATAAQSERPNWQLFDEHHARNVTAAFAELEWE